MAVRPLLPLLFFFFTGAAICQDTLSSDHGANPAQSVDSYEDGIEISSLVIDHLRRGRRDSASFYHELFLSSSHAFMADIEVLSSVKNYADRLMDLGETHWALDVYKGLKNVRSVNDSLYIAWGYDMGWAEVVLGFFDQAAATYRDIASSSEDEDSQYLSAVFEAYCHVNRGLVDSASLALKAALQYEVHPPFALYPGCEAMIALYSGDTTAAVLASEKALSLAKVQNEQRLQTGLYLRFAQALLGLGLREEAFLVADSAVMVSGVLTPRVEAVEAYRVQATMLQAAGRHEDALLSLVRYNQRRDSLLTGLVGMPAANLQQIATENASLAKKLDQAEQALNIKRNWIIVLVATLFASLFFSVRYLRTLRKSKWAYTKLQESNRKVVTQSKEIALAQEEIIKSEKMAFLGRVFAGVGHELNTPIAAVKANLQLIEDAQMQEIRKLKELANVFTPHILEVMTDLIIASYQAQQNPLSTIKQRALKKTLRSYFQDELNGDPMDFADMFDDLKVYDGLKRFEPVYRHENGVDILELVMFISHRTRSIFTAMEALQRADKILFSLKSYSFKNLQDEKVEFDLIRNINNIITLHQNKLKNVTVYKQFEESVEIEGYPDELTQVWTNLISNATYANKYRGNLWIRVKQYENKVQVDIEDSGGGVDPQVMERIFEPFETTKPEGEGTGLGLSITKRVIDKHKGTITVGNTETGALFSVTLPKTLP